MQLEQRIFNPASGWSSPRAGQNGNPAQLVLAFGDRMLLASGTGLEELRRHYPEAQVVTASSSGEIVDTEVIDGGIAATAMAFSSTQIRCAEMRVDRSEDSSSVGAKLADDLAGPDLAHILVISDGQRVNGAELARGFNEHLPAGVRLTGGMAGDGSRFESTLVGLNETPGPNRVVAIAFYGRKIEVGYGCAGGWETFGPERTVTRADGNVLFELDGQLALSLYKEYLGDQAAALPASALHFPLGVQLPDTDEVVVRTILSIDEATGSMTFAGDVPTGSRAWLMRASFEDLIGGAEAAAEQAQRGEPPDVAICVSCVGRRLVLGQRSEEETECIRAVFGSGPVITGFYSYGELAPSNQDNACRLHNETMTITTLREF